MQVSQALRPGVPGSVCGAHDAARKGRLLKQKRTICVCKPHVSSDRECLEVVVVPMMQPE